MEDFFFLLSIKKRLSIICQIKKILFYSLATISTTVIQTIVPPVFWAHAADAHVKMPTHAHWKAMEMFSVTAIKDMLEIDALVCLIYIQAFILTSPQNQSISLLIFFSFSKLFFLFPQFHNFILFLIYHFSHILIFFYTLTNPIPRNKSKCRR